MGVRLSKYKIPDNCYPSYQYTKRHAATIADGYKALKQRILQLPVIDIDRRTDITLDVYEPLNNALSPNDIVLRASESCRLKSETILGKELSQLSSSSYVESAIKSTIIAIEMFRVEGSEIKSSQQYLLLMEDEKHDIAAFENLKSNGVDEGLSKNAKIKIGEILERDILCQLENICKEVEKVRCIIESRRQQMIAKDQKIISKPCLCSTDKTDKRSCKCHEDIKRLLADIMGLFKRSKVPEDQKPKLSIDMGIEVDRKVIDALKKTSRCIDYCGYNLDTLYVFVDERYPSETLKAKIENTMVELRINDFRILSSFVEEYTNPASGSEVFVKTYEGKKLSGTLTAFGRLENNNQRMIAIMSRHLAIFSMDKKLYLQHGLNYVTGDIMKQLFKLDPANTVLEQAGASNEDEKQTKSVKSTNTYMDIAFAYIDKKDEHVCDTMYRTDENQPIAGRLCAFDSEQMYRLPVYIRGNATGLGRGIVSVSKIIPVNNAENHLLMIEDTNGNAFCQEGDSGAMVCADDPENYGEKVQLISMVMGALLGEDGTYTTLKIKEGLDYLADEVGENINIC